MPARRGKIKYCGGRELRYLQHRLNSLQSFIFVAETLVAEEVEFGLEMPYLGDEAYYRYFLNWNGELRIVQNIKLRRCRRKELEGESMES